MHTTIYEYRDYKQYFVDLIDGNDSGGRGKRKELAESIGCQISHITNVLAGPAHFSQEQAEAASRFFGLNAQETEFILLLVQYLRAGTVSLKKFYENLIQERQDKFTALKNRLRMPDSLREQEETRYYSGWQFSAIHVLLSIPGCQKREAIAKKLEIPLAKVDEILSFLVSAGLCRKDGQHYQIARPLLHLDKTSPLISKHHTNWRLKSIMSLDKASELDLHYSSVFTLSEEDYPRVREILTKAISEALKVITVSTEETAATICLDLFKL